MTFTELLKKYRDFSFSQRDKGTRFERLMRAFLQTAKPYADRFSKVWLWGDFPCKGDFEGAKDTGIDLVAKTKDGEYWAIQCKCYDETKSIDKPSVDTFLSTSGKSFKAENGETKQFSKRLWISTTNKWNHKAQVAIKNQTPEVIRISLTDLMNAPVDWQALEKDVHGQAARNPQKKLREHQQEALDNFNAHFKTADRGKLIMACGTGKTFTSLKIAENEGAHFVLFLAPSIALVGQTLREWCAESEKPIQPICVCSDPTVSKKKNKNSGDNAVIDLAWPASTNVDYIVEQINNAERDYPDSMVVIFSTYQSIDVVSKTQKKIGREFDLIICDEAHRTTGVTLKDKEDSAFVKVHDNDFIKSKKRLYMTATPRLYHPETKIRAKENHAILCSMDDVKLYGEEVYRIGFGKAVDAKLLSDYKVMVLTVTQDDIPDDIQIEVSDKGTTISVEDASKLIGCINALSKRLLIDHGMLKATDPQPMRKAVAFCQTIKKSKAITEIFNAYKDTYYDSLPIAERNDIVNISSDHIDGTMDATKREELLTWLNSSPADGNECRILNNVRCLSEGVDVPSLDAVMFLSAKDSQIDVVQSVGRVMRKADGKQYGYIIIPVLVPADEDADKALDDNDRYKVVWNVLTALRAHDDRFDSIINKIELNKAKSPVIIIDSPGGSKPKPSSDEKPKPVVFPLERIKALQDSVYARMVIKVGNRKYWEQWAKEVAEIAQRYTERINKLIAKPGAHQKAFKKFLVEIQKNINPSVTADEVVEMLSQHYITKPVFEALFENYSFVKENPVSQALQDIIDLLEEQAFEKDTIALSRFYDSVRLSVSNIDNAPARQRIITELYDKFFRTAFPLTVERLGIVYTPVEIVDFINNSVAGILKKTFNKSLSDEDVNVLDPFTGTGTFIARLIESGLIDKEALPRKYADELFANEIILLAYYIASINIENAYHSAMGDDTPYAPFAGICLTDTFQLGEKNKQGVLDASFLKRNSERVQKEENKKFQVILGNPPYSVGQKSAMDDAQNQTYSNLEKRVSVTYAKKSSANNKKSLYDSYIKAFRWASDRIDPVQGGMIAFVSNASWIDGNAMDGMRKCFENEFSDIYIFNLRGNQRTSGETSKKEGGKIFGSGSRTPIAITILVKNPDHFGNATIHYKDIGDYLSKEQKLKIISETESVLSDDFDFLTLHTDINSDWLNHGKDIFNQFITISDKNSNKYDSFFIPVYSNGLKTNADSWMYNFSAKKLSTNMSLFVETYNNEIQRHIEKGIDIKFPKFCTKDKSKIKWHSGILPKATKHITGKFNNGYVFESLYMPFTKEFAYYDKFFVQRVSQLPKIFPTKYLDNLIICVSGIGDRKGFSALISNLIPSVAILESAQCFPLYYYEKKSIIQQTLIDSVSESQYSRKDAITDFILERCQENYGKRVTKEDIFYYVYGLLHSPEYRKTFAADLKKSLPRLPLMARPNDFWDFSNAGRQLALWHLNYETQPEPKEVIISGGDNYRVVKMRFAKKDRTKIYYNDSITISNIPLAAYEYVVNGRSAIEWVMERYKIKTDKASRIVNDPNDWAKEHDKPRYILDLLLSVITVSLETMKIVKGLPKLEF